MSYLERIQAAQGDPELIEVLYQNARQFKEEPAFSEAMLVCCEQFPGDVLYKAWYYRLRVTQEPDRTIHWKWAILLSLIVGVIFWFLSDERLELVDAMPYVMLVWAPIATCFVIVFLQIESKAGWKWPAISIVGLLIAALYVTLFVVFRRREQYQLLMMLHLPVLAWIGCGISILGWRSNYENRFAFLIKSIEVFITGGLYAGAGGAFAGITIGMFEALDITLPGSVLRLLFAGGFGLIPVLAVASVYDPRVTPIAQRFQQGLGRVISTLMRLLLPLTLLVLIIYLLVIPFNFMAPFRNRDVLIVYNVMLFAVMGLLVGATPVQTTDVAQKHHRVLRSGILAVAILAAAVSLYALSATVYRTALGGITINRLTIIGWNSINIGILLTLIYKQFRDGVDGWIPSLHTVFGWATTAYMVWTAFLVIFIALLFRG